MELKTIIGITAGILTATSTIPQIIKVWKEQDATQVAAGMLFVLLAGNTLWATYGFMQKDLPIIVTNLFSVVCDIILIILNFRYTKK